MPISPNSGPGQIGIHSSVKARHAFSAKGHYVIKNPSSVVRPVIG